MASGICIDCGSDLPSRVGKRCKPCSGDDYEKRHKRVTAQQLIIAVLQNCSECGVKEMTRLIPKSEDAIEAALRKMMHEKVIRRTATGIYALRRDALPESPPPPKVVPFPVTRADFIAPIPKHRLMAGRA